MLNGLERPDKMSELTDTAGRSARGCFRGRAIWMWLAAGVMGCAAGCDRERAGNRPARGVTVLAAASTTEWVEQIGTVFEKRTGIPVHGSFSASSTLARQIEAGAHCDVFVSAEPLWVDELERQGLLKPGSRREVMGNDLVLIVPKGKAFKATFEQGFRFGDALKGRLAMGDPQSVPAGRYARQALEALGWWEGVRDRILPAADVRAAVRLVERGEADAGIVYRTDVAGSDGLETIGVVPADLHEPIVYEAAACRGSGAEAGRFLEFLGSPEAREVIERLGFRPPARSRPAGGATPH